MLKNCRHLEFARVHLKKRRSICRNQVFVSQVERIVYFWSVVCWTIAHFVLYNGVIYCLSGVSVHLVTVH